MRTKSFRAIVLAIGVLVSSGSSAIADIDMCRICVMNYTLDHGLSDGRCVLPPSGTWGNDRCILMPWGWRNEVCEESGSSCYYIEVNG
jgi:hypothetical protein